MKGEKQQRGAVWATRTANGVYPFFLSRLWGGEKIVTELMERGGGGGGPFCYRGPKAGHV